MHLTTVRHVHPHRAYVRRAAHLQGRVGPAARRARLWASEGPAASASSPLRRPVSMAAAELPGDPIACAGQSRLNEMA